MAHRQEEASLSRWSWRLGIIGLGLMSVLFLLGYGLGPGIVGALYGAAFSPEPVVAGLAAAGVGAAFPVLFIAQIFVARGNTRALAVGWLVALAAASVGVVLSGGDAVTRTALGFVVGEFTALAGLSVTGALIRSGTATLSDGEQ